VGVLTVFAAGNSGPAAGSGSAPATLPESVAVGSIDSSDTLDPSSSLRLLPNAPAPSYASNPPTSGAFQVGAQSAPVSTTELSPVVQVGLLAQGDVLIQYRDLESADVAALQSLAGDEVVVAPNSSLPAPIVATAWRKRRTCTTVDIDDLRQFATLNGNQGPTGRPLGTAASTTTTS